MKKTHKLGILTAGLLAATFAISGCTASFCSNEEKSRILFAVEPGVSMYYESQEAALTARRENYTYTDPAKVWDSNDNIWRMVETNSNGEYTKSNQLAAIINNAKSSGYYVPSLDYFTALDTVVAEKALAASSISVESATVTDLLGYDKENGYHVQGALDKFGYLKFYGDDDTVWGYYDVVNAKLKIELGDEKCPSNDFVTLYKNTMNSATNNYRSCIATVDGQYGSYGQNGTTVTITGKSWGDAWHKGGAVLEGLIVYPVAWMVDQFAYIFAGGSNCTPEQLALAYAGGVPQLLALLVVTVIVRLFIFLVTFKTTLSQQKMQRLQPEIAKIQAKYPNANTNQAQKQRMAEEQMKLYKKNKVNPLSSLLTLIIQFPIFIGVWGAMTGSAVLSTGAVLNLNLSSSIWNTLTNVSQLPSNNTGWWTALVLIILMSVAQFMAMKVPQWITKIRTKKIARLGKNPAQTSQNRTMTIVSYVMLIMIIVMGFTLPAAMGVYWFIGAIVSLIQTLVTQLLITGRKPKNNN